MLVDVRDYGSSRTADFPASSRGGELLTEVAAVVAELSKQAIVQTATTGGVRVSGAAKARLRASLREDLGALIRTARVITADNPDLEKKFRLPKVGDQLLLNAARAFLEDAEPFAAEFPKHEISADVLVKFRSDIDALQAAISERNQNRGSRIQARARLQTLLSRGIKALRKLDVIVRNKFRADQPSLTAWDSAKHVERTRKKIDGGAKPNQATADTVKAKSLGVAAAG